VLTTQLLSFLTHVGVALVGILAVVGLYMFMGGRTRRDLPPSDSSTH